MPIYDGVVTFAEDDIPVIIELSADVVRLSASGREIGEWAKGECQIRHLGNSTFAIEAEDETLSFVPNQPSLFAAAVNGGLPADEPQTTQTRPQAAEQSAAEPSPTGPATDVRQAPPPRPVTMGLFYALCLLTAALALWSIISIIF